MRPHCLLCDKPSPLCVCNLMQPVDNRCALTILQHPRERRHPIGTARLLRLGLRHVNLEVCYKLTSLREQARLQAVPNVGILYPHAQAQPLSQLQGKPPDHLVVLDGTWAHARSLYRHNPWLHHVPHYRIDPDGVDRYLIRREPRADYTSTVEAVVHALRLIEPQTVGITTLLDAFNTMITQHMQRMAPAGLGQRKRLRRTLRRDRLPALWQESQALQVVVTCEFILRRTGCTPPHPGGRRQLVYLAACHRASGKIFHAAIKPGPADDPIAPTHLESMGLAQSLLNEAMTAAELAQAWRMFCPPGATFLAWNGGSLAVAQSILGASGQGLSSALLLKTLYCNALQRQSGHLEDVLLRHHIVPLSLPCPGRPGIRLRAAAGLAQWFDALACGEAQGA